MFDKKKKHNESFSEDSKREAIKLKKKTQSFQDAIHLQPKTLIFTLRALV